MMDNKELMQKIEKLERDLNEIKNKRSVKEYFKNAFRKTNVLVGAGAAFLLVSLFVYAGTVAKPFTFSSNDPISSSQVNSNFDTLYNLVNGNLNDDNVSGISASKINAGTLTYDRLPAVVMWSGGTWHDGQDDGWNTYLLEACDINTASGYLDINANGTVTVNQTGYYRVHAHALCSTQAEDYNYAQIVKNGASVIYSIDTFEPVAGLNRTVVMDQVFYFTAGEYFIIRYYAYGGHFAYFSKTSSQSGLEVTYLGHN